MNGFLRFTGFVLSVYLVVPATAADAGHVPGRLLLGHRETIDANLLERTVRAHGAAVRRHLPGLGLHVIDVPEEASEAILESLRRTGLFDYVERDHYAR